MKLRLNRNEKVLVGFGLGLSAIALGGLIYYFVAYFRLSITAHYLTIRLAGNPSTGTGLILVLEIFILAAITCALSGAGLHRKRTQRASAVTNPTVGDEGLPSA